MLLRRGRFLIFCAALLLAAFPFASPSLSFDAAEFWREPDVPFDIKPDDAGTDTGNFSSRRNRGQRNENRQGVSVQWRSFTFTSEIYEGVPMRVYALYARPAAPGKYPAILSLHGGLDRARRDRVVAFARAGYACLAFDWQPLTEKSALTASPPRTVYANLDYSDWGQMFSSPGADGKRPVIYRAIIAARRALTWLAQQEEVDGTRLGVEGHSWGGFLAQLLAGVDGRVRAVVSSAAAGAWLRRYAEMPRHPARPNSLVPPELPEESVAGSGVADVYFDGSRDAIVDGHRFGDLSPWQMFEWTQRYDPAAYADTMTAPILLRLGASDFFGSVDGLGDYWDKIRTPKALQLLPAGNHTFADVETRLDWFDYWLKNTVRDAPRDTSRGASRPVSTAFLPGQIAGPYPQIGALKLTPNANGSWTATVSASGPAALTGQLAWTTSPGSAVTRVWAQRPLTFKDGIWTATFTPRSVDSSNTLRVFASLRDAAGHVASTLPQLQTLGESTAFVSRSIDIPPSQPKPATKTVPASETIPLTAPLRNEATLSIARVAVSPLVNPAEWNKAREIGPVAASPEMIGERDTRLRALWDNDNLYLRFVVADPTPWQVSHPNAAWWLADALHLRLNTAELALDSAANNAFNPPHVLHMGLFNAALPNGAPGAVAYRDVAITQQEYDLSSLYMRVEMSDAGYTLTLRLPWRWIDTQFAPQAGRTFRLAFLVNDGDLLTNEPLPTANFNNAHALYKPEVWGLAQLENGAG